MIPPILRDFPTSFYSERLLIRAPRPGDGAELYTAVRESRDELRPWMVWADEHERVEQSEEQVRKAACAFQERTELRLLLFLKGTGVLVGSSGLHEIDWDVPRFEIGYWVRTSFAGQGYITEAVRAITGFAFECLGARRVAIRCDARNERSARVAERAGYRLEGTLRNEARAADGQLGDTRIYAMLPEEYPRPADGDDRR